MRLETRLEKGASSINSINGITSGRNAGSDSEQMQEAFRIIAGNLWEIGN